MLRRFGESRVELNLPYFMKSKAFMNLLIIRFAALLGLGAFAGTAFGQEAPPFPDGFNPAQPAADMVGIGVMFVALLVSVAIVIAIMAVVCFFVVQNYKAIPAEHRTMEPGKVWLALIPLFNLYWVFPVFLGLADSYKKYFNSAGDESVGDCNRQLSLWFCIAFCCAHVPCVNYVAGPAALVLLIIVLVKAFDLKKKVEAGA